MQRGQKRVRPTNSREMLLQEAGGEDKRAADTTAEEDGKGGTASARGLLQRQPVRASLLRLSGRSAPGNLPHAPPDKRAVLCVKRHCGRARQAVNQSF